jgi:hypothetical protein
MNVKGHTFGAWTTPIVVLQHGSLESAAAVLNSGKRTAILVGDEIEPSADIPAAPFIQGSAG